MSFGPHRGATPRVDRSPSAALLDLAAERYQLPKETSFAFLRHGENTTYEVRARDGRRWALRVHRPGYQTGETIRSEIAWMQGLREAGIATPFAEIGRDGDVLQRLPLPDGDEILVTMLRWVEGTPLSAVNEVAPWRELGELIARLHEHSRTWLRPLGFFRHAWDAEALVGERPRWGPPDPDHVFPAQERELIDRCREEVRARLHAIGKARDVYGLIHGDLGFENVLVGFDGKVAVIDFDDSGESWFAYDLAVALYPHEGCSGFEERRDALVAGYRRVQELPPEMLAELPTFLLARRIASLGWVFSHADTEHARAQRRRRLNSTPEATRRFLAWSGATEVRLNSGG